MTAEFKDPSFLSLGFVHRWAIMTKSAKDNPEVGAEAPETNSSSDLASAARKTAGRGVWMGTAVGIGSAAIVAALLYANKKRS